jgi:hypothetical protein
VKISKFVCLFVCVFATGSTFAFSTLNGYKATELYRATETKIWGLALDGGNLYFGQQSTILSYNLASGTHSVESTVPQNAGFAYVTRSNGSTYAAYGTSSNSPWPYVMGNVESGTFNAQVTLNGVFDGAFSPSGDLYVVGDGESARIYKYNAGSSTTTEIAHVGGYCAGLTFDSEGNLYFADQGEWGVRSGGIRKFTAAQVAAGNFSANDGQLMMEVYAGLINFDSEGNFYATHYVYNNGQYIPTLSKYDLSSGTLLADIASGDMANFVFAGDTMYLVDSPWDGDSAIYAITVPEPATMLIFGLGAIFFSRSRKK